MEGRARGPRAIGKANGRMRVVCSLAARIFGRTQPLAVTGIEASDTRLRDRYTLIVGSTLKFFFVGSHGER